MKNLTKIVLLAVVFVGFTSVAKADTKCGDPSQSNMTTTYVPCSNGSPENVQAVWGTNASVPHISGGQTAVDEGGVASFCPSFIATCVDITHTSYYRTQMQTLARQLVANGFISQFPSLAGWVGK